MNRPEGKFHLELIERHLATFRDLTVTLAGKYPIPRTGLIEVVEPAVRHLCDSLRIIRRSRSKLGIRAERARN